MQNFVVFLFFLIDTLNGISIMISRIKKTTSLNLAALGLETE